VRSCRTGRLFACADSASATVDSRSRRCRAVIAWPCVVRCAECDGGVREVDPPRYGPALSLRRPAGIRPRHQGPPSLTPWPATGHAVAETRVGRLAGILAGHISPFPAAAPPLGKVCDSFSTPVQCLPRTWVGIMQALEFVGSCGGFGPPPCTALRASGPGGVHPLKILAVMNINFAVGVVLHALQTCGAHARDTLPAFCWEG
jgi:hypothetical protein